MIVVNKKFLKLAEIASSDGLRMELNGVIIKENLDGNYTARATNGHIMVRVADKSLNGTELGESLVDDEYTVPREALLRAKSGKNPQSITKDKDGFCEVRSFTKQGGIEQVVKVKSITEKMHIKKLDSVIPTEKPVFEIYFNPRLLISICNVIVNLSHSSMPAVKFQFFGATKPTKLVLDTEEDREVLGLIMPMIGKDVLP